MQISLKTIRDRHVGISWMPSPVSLMLLGLVNNKTSVNPVAFSDWYNDNPFTPDYIPVVFTPSSTSLVWETDWVQPYKALSITANCAWRIHSDTNLNGVVAITAVGSNVILADAADPIEAIRGGDGAIDIWALYEGAPGTATIVLEYRDTTQYTKVNISITVNAHGMGQTFMIEPMTFEIDGDQQQLTTKAYYAGDVSLHPAPTVQSKPTWMTLDSITKDPTSPDSQPIYDVIFDVDDFTKTCPSHPREGSFTLTSDNGNASANVRQQSRIITPQPWPALSTGVVEDADGNEYHYITIGDYQILLRNLFTTKYNDASSIPFINESTWSSDAWYNLTTHGCTWNYPIYQRFVPLAWSHTDRLRYGLLYNFYAIEQSQAKGGFMADSADAYAVANSYSDDYMWHVPTYAEMIQIIETLTSDITGWEAKLAVAGSRMKCTRTLPTGEPRWNKPNEANNSSSYSLFPAGGLISSVYGSASRRATKMYGSEAILYTSSTNTIGSIDHPILYRTRYDWEKLMAGYASVDVPYRYTKATGASIRLIRKHDL